MTSWIKTLNPATFRGCRFGVLGSEAAFGRRVAVHEYPGRDKPYVEDMGRATRRITIAGFLVENSLIYGGDTVIEQRDLLVAAAETKGPGLLIHPTLGLLQVSIPPGGLVVSERWDEGRYFEFRMTFIESGFKVFPTTKAASKSLLDTLVAKLGIASLSDFVSSVEATISTVFKAINTAEGLVSDALDTVESVIEVGQSAVSSVISTIASVQVLAGRIMNDASSITSLTSLLTGDYGRYASGSVSSALQQSQKTLDSSATISSLIADSVVQRAAVATASDTLATAAAGFSAATVETFAEAAQDLVTTLVAGIATPADQIRLLSSLASFTTSNYSSTSQIGQAKTVAQYVTAALVRRAAIGALATAASDYAPSSYDDALTVRDTVVALVDAEILIAGDLGDDATYAALVAVRQAVVADLNERGASLAPLDTFTFGGNMPSLVLAQRLYQDATRSDELIGEADPIHPAFMPASFRALAS